MKKRYISYKETNGHVLEIARQIAMEGSWKPDCIVAITRGGLYPGVQLSHYLNVPMFTLDVRLRDTTGDLDVGPETNAWLAEWAYGYDESADAIYDPENGKIKVDKDNVKNILIVDDINDSGETFNWIKKDWQSSCLPNSPAWEYIWGSNVRFAALMNNVMSEAEIDYTGEDINKHENPEWIVFPWEEWWKLI